MDDCAEPQAASEVIVLNLAPPAPLITFDKFTNGVDADELNGSTAPHIAPGDLVTWSYRVTNADAAAFPEGDVTVTDSVPGVIPVRVLPDPSGNDDNLLEPGETWLYEASGSALDLGAEPLGDPIFTGCDGPPSGSGQVYRNTGTVTVQGNSTTDSSHYCNPPI